MCISCLVINIVDISVVGCIVNEHWLNDLRWYSGCARICGAFEKEKNNFKILVGFVCCL